MTGERRRRKRRKTQIRKKKKRRRKKEDADQEEEKKVCDFHIILCGFTNLVCFGIAISNLRVRRRDKKTENGTGEVVFIFLFLV